MNQQPQTVPHQQISQAAQQILDLAKPETRPNNRVDVRHNDGKQVWRIRIEPA